MPNFIKNLFSNRDEKKEVITVEKVKETKNELVNTVDESPKNKLNLQPLNQMKKLLIVIVSKKN